MAMCDALDHAMNARVCADLDIAHTEGRPGALPGKYQSLHSKAKLRLQDVAGGRTRMLQEVLSMRNTGV